MGLNRIQERRRELRLPGRQAAKLQIKDKNAVSRVVGDLYFIK